jgi:hypothetical protein
MSTVALRRGGISLVVGFGGAALVAVMVLLVGTIVNTMRDPKPVKSSTPPVSAVVWGDYVFSSPPAMAHWLKVHGVAYSIWADRHPPANRLLKKHSHKKSR